MQPVCDGVCGDVYVLLVFDCEWWALPACIQWRKRRASELRAFVVVQYLRRQRDGLAIAPELYFVGQVLAGAVRVSVCVTV